VSLFILDTDTVSNFLREQPAVTAAVARREVKELATTVITFDELWTGWATALGKARTTAQIAVAYERQTTTLNQLRFLQYLTFSIPAIERYAALKKQKLNVKANDMKIAAIALEAGAVVVTHNLRDFNRIPGLVVEDWC
jgi:tRNA(fMet)-specific endonuclease VapC